MYRIPVFTGVIHCLPPPNLSTLRNTSPKMKWIFSDLNLGGLTHIYQMNLFAQMQASPIEMCLLQIMKLSLNQGYVGFMVHIVI